MNFLVIARDLGSAESLAEFSRKLEGFQDAVWEDAASHAGRARRTWIWKQQGTGRTALRYQELVRWIQAQAGLPDGSLPLNGVVVLVDQVDPELLNAAAEEPQDLEGEWGCLLAMLILTFPEIHWAFGVVHDTGDQPWVRSHSLQKLCSHTPRDPLFDGSGLRQVVKKKTARSIPDHDTVRYPIPLRELCAAAIDEESAYTYFHAHTAFRYGFRVDVVTSWGLMRELFHSADPTKVHGYHLLLEDMNLNFPDRTGEVHLSNPAKRAEHCSLLAQNNGAKKRLIITAGDSFSNPEVENWKKRLLVTSDRDPCADGGTAQRNIARKPGDPSGPGRRVAGWCQRLLYRASQAEEPPQPPAAGGLIMKPAGGMMDLWIKSGMDHVDHLRERYDGGFQWPPARPVCPGGNAPHSAQGKLMLVAETLLRRAETLRGLARTVSDYIKGAVMATEAMELLSGKTRTLSLDALRLKHEFEVLAECAFLGVGYHFNVKARIAEIQEDCAAFFQDGNPSQSGGSEASARGAILNNIAFILRDAGRYEEESEVLVEVRRANRSFERNQKRSTPGQWGRYLVNLSLQYAEAIIASFPRFIGVLVTYIVALSLLVAVLGHHPEASQAQRLIRGFYITVEAFVGGNVASGNLAETILTVFAAFCGLFHFGVFISLVYAIISRR